MRQRQGDGYQQRYGEFHRNNWGDGDTESGYCVGDIVWVPEDCEAATSGRVETPGLNRVVAVFSIDEAPAFYYRVCPVTLEVPRGTKAVTDNAASSGRVHVIPGKCDYTAGWTLVHAADRSAHRAALAALPAVPLSEDETPLSVRNSPDAPDGATNRDDSSARAGWRAGGGDS